MGKQWKQWDFILGGSKITADGDRSHEIKRHLLLGRKVMTNLDSLLKSRDIALPTKVHLFKAMGWKLEYEESRVPKNWCFWTMVLEKTLESPVDCKKIQPVHPKGNQSWIIIGRTDPEAETPIPWCEELTHWKRPWCWKDWRREEKGMTEDKMVRWRHWLDGHEFEWAPGADDGQGSMACCSP